MVHGSSRTEPIKFNVPLNNARALKICVSPLREKTRLVADFQLNKAINFTDDRVKHQPPHAPLHPPPDPPEMHECRHLIQWPGCQSDKRQNQIARSRSSRRGGLTGAWPVAVCYLPIFLKPSTRNMSVTNPNRIISFKLPSHSILPSAN